MKRLGIIGAMEMEIETLKKEMKIEEIKEHASMQFYRGTLDKTEVVVVRCGVGKVNAALCVQTLVDLFEVSCIINTGVAGSLSGQLKIGDIVISSAAIHHDVDVRIFGYALGEVPGLKTVEFKASEELIALSEKCCREVNPDTNVVVGKIVSGDSFVSNRETKDALFSNFHALCAEMEGASVAQSAFLNHVPFVIIRAISDQADENDKDMDDYPTFERKAAIHCAKLVREIAGRV